MAEENQKNQIASSYETPYGIDMHTLETRSHFTDHIRRVLLLPKRVQNILIDFSTAEFIEEKVGQTFNLTTDQKAELTRILRDILLADSFWGDFQSLVSSRLRVNVNISEQIVKMIVEQLLTPALEDIKKMQMEKFGNISKVSPTQFNKPADFVKPGESVQQSNVIDLRNRNNK